MKRAIALQNGIISLHSTSPRETVLNNTNLAHLIPNVTTPFYPNTEYGKLSSAEVRDRLWQDIDVGIGLVHIPHDLAHEHGLPRSQIFPWDRTQEIYYPAAFHQLHCLKQVYSWLSFSQKGQQPNETYEHIMHCMDTLLQDIYCHADNTPWYLPPLEWEKHGYAKIQHRQCRDWDQLLGWVKEKSACFKFIAEEDGDYLEHFHFCPKGSPYRTLMEKHFERKAQNEAEAHRGG